MKKFIILPALVISMLTITAFAQSSYENHTGQDVMLQHMYDDDMNGGSGRYSDRSHSSRRGYGGSCCY